MSVDDRVRDELRRAATSITPSLEEDLRAVRRGARTQAIRWRTFVVTAIVLASIAVALSASHVRSWWNTSPAEPSPSVVQPGTVPNPFDVVRRFTPADLGLQHVKAFAIGPDGNLYVIDAGQRVSVITPQGDTLRQWGKHGPQQGQFRLGKGGIAVGQDGQVYVTDSGNDRVQVFTADGGFVRQFGSPGKGPGSFKMPWNIAVDEAGDVYVGDDWRATVSAFAPDGSFRWRIGGAASTYDEVGHEHFAVTDSLGRLVSANDDTGRVIYLSSSGQVVDAFGTQNGVIPAESPFQTGGELRHGACDATVDASDDVIVNSCPGPVSNTEVFDASHQLIGAWYGSPFKLAPRFGPDGEVFALSRDGSILELTMSSPSG